MESATPTSPEEKPSSPAAAEVSPAARRPGPHSRRLHLFLHGLAGAMLVLAVIVPGWFIELAPCWIALRQPLAAAGVILALLGWLTYRPRLARLSAGFCVAVMMLIVVLTGADVLFRVIGYDFDRQQAALRHLPPFYRRPSVRTGEIYFRRPGPQVWTGKVIAGAVEALHLQTDFYRDEHPITVRYDAQGFRNDPPLSDWEIAVAGDSFTELGFLPQDRLFTTLLAEKLGVRVRNLGVSHTGPLTQLHYLRTYGLAPSTRRVAIAFYEGNDLDNLDLKYSQWRRFRKTGWRPAGLFHPQTSLLRAIGQAILRADVRHSPPNEVVPDAFLHLGGRTIPVSFDDVPVGSAEVAPETREALEYVFREYAAFARAHHVQPWLFYFPCKVRVWHGMLEFNEKTRVDASDWQPTDLPEYLRRLARGHGLYFVDLTPALIRETRATQKLLFNPIVDTHFTALGSAVVADELARVLRQVPPTARREVATAPPGKETAVHSPPRAAESARDGSERLPEK